MFVGEALQIVPDDDEVKVALVGEVECGDNFFRPITMPHAKLQLDRLASESLVLDQAFVTSPQLADLYRLFWQIPGVSHSTNSLGKLLENAGVRSTLITDDAKVADHDLAGGFSEILQLDAPRAEDPADDISQTGLAQPFIAASDWLSATEEPFLLWIHSLGMGASWDAPLELRDQFAEEGDPTPPRFTQVPSLILPEDFDPDELLGINHAYAGQVSLLDGCAGTVLEQIRRSPLFRNTLVVFMSARGFLLGEHARIGPYDEHLHNELTQIACILRCPDALDGPMRSQALVQSSDLSATLLQWWGLSPSLDVASGKSLLSLARQETNSLREFMTLHSGLEQAIRTDAWYLRIEKTLGFARPQLFAKPSDRWEVNDVASRCPEILAGLQEALQRSGEAGKAAKLKGTKAANNVLKQSGTAVAASTKAPVPRN
jgi:arylsulfatase A-like enzyme